MIRDYHPTVHKLNGLADELRNAQNSYFAFINSLKTPEVSEKLVTHSHLTDIPMYGLCFSYLKTNFGVRFEVVVEQNKLYVKLILARYKCVNEKVCEGDILATAFFNDDGAIRLNTFDGEELRNDARAPITFLVSSLADHYQVTT